MKNHLQRYHVKNARHQDYRIGYPREILMIDLIGYPDFTPEVYTCDAKSIIEALLVDGHLLHLVMIPLPFLSVLIILQEMCYYGKTSPFFIQRSGVGQMSNIKEAVQPSDKFHLFYAKFYQDFIGGGNFAYKFTVKKWCPF